MKKSNIDFKTLLPQATALLKVAFKQAAFIGTLLVLLIYLVMVWHIRQLAGSESETGTNTTVVKAAPKIDQQTIDHVQSLERHSPQLRSLFEKARKNPFQE